MHEMFGSICDSLTRQLDCYKALIDLTEKERACLRQKDGPGLSAVLREKESVLFAVKEVEAQRKRQIRDLAQQAHIAEEALTVSRMIELAAQPHLERLQRIRQEIREVSAALAAATRRNALLVEYLQDYSRDMVGLLLALNGQATVYRRNGGMENCRPGINTALR